MSDEIPKMLAASVLDMSKEAVNKTYQLVGFLLLVGGWIATSTDARTLIQGHVGIVTCGLVLAALLYIVLIFATYGPPKAEFFRRIPPFAAEFFTSIPPSGRRFFRSIPPSEKPVFRKDSPLRVTR